MGRTKWLVRSIAAGAFQSRPDIVRLT